MMQDNNIDENISKQLIIIMAVEFSSKLDI